MKADEVYAILNKRMKGSGGGADAEKLEQLEKRIEQAEKKITTVYSYKGSLEDESALPEDAAVGDVYNLEKSETYGDGANVAWDGTQWDDLGVAFHAEAYPEFSDFQEMTNDDIDKIFENAGGN